MMQTRDTNRRYLLALIACWIISRLIYLLYFGLRIDIGPLSSYLQYIDPALLRTSLLQSTFYLREQPPGFNLFLGIVLKIFGDHAVSAFQACYLGCGIGLAVVLFLLLRRLGALPPIAFFVAALFCLSPITILYENWLFYTYPLTFLLSLSALFLLRYRESARTLDAAVFFWILAAIVMSRGIFHAVWLLATFGMLWWLGPPNRGQIAAAFALPFVLVCSWNIKNYFVFGPMLSGEVYQSTNFGMMVFERLPAGAQQKLLSEGKLSELSRLSPYEWNISHFRRFNPKLESTGIPLLDQEVKSTGATNWHSLAVAELSRSYYREAKIAAKQYPKAYFRAVASNFFRYFLPADESWPFPNENSQKISKLLDCWHFLFAGQFPFTGRIPWFNLLAFPASFLFGCYALFRKRGSEVVPFILFNIVYLFAVTTLFSVSDHNRYRYKISPFYAVLFGLLVSECIRSVRALRARDRFGRPASVARR